LLPGAGLMFFWISRSPHLWALLEFSPKKNDIFNILWVLVFGFATLNILSLVARRFEPQRHRLSFGETMAIGVVLMSVVLLGYEMATVFKIFPLKLHVQ
jgi:dipeptide/tripeptide permease